MEAEQAVDLGREALLTALTVGGPVLLVGLAVGLVVGLLQTVTQVQDQTLALVPKLVAVVAAIGVCLPWLIQRMVEYSQVLFTNIPMTVMGR